MNTEIQTIDKEQALIIEQKKQIWSEMGVATYNAELKLQAMASDACNKFSIPEKYEDLQEAESDLKNLKASQKQIETERKSITSKFDDLSSRLMISEKSINEPIKVLTEAIISVKKVYETKQKIVMLHNQERDNIKAMVLNYVNAKDSELKSFISNKVSTALTNALSVANISIKGVNDYLLEWQNKYTSTTFTAPLPIHTAINISQEEANSIITNNFKWDGIFYYTLYKTELLKKFSDYEVQFHNKQQAIEIANKQEVEKQQALAIEKSNKKTALKLASIATPIDSISNSAVKELKKTYEVDMPETIESVLAIMGAFSANIHLCMPKLKVNKWFAFTPLQAGNTLAKVKCDDNNFAPQGIIFKEVSKL